MNKDYIPEEDLRMIVNSLKKIRRDKRTRKKFRGFNRLLRFADKKLTKLNHIVFYTDDKHIPFHVRNIMNKCSKGMSIIYDLKEYKVIDYDMPWYPDKILEFKSVLSKYYSVVKSELIYRLMEDLLVFKDERRTNRIIEDPNVLIGALELYDESYYDKMEEIENFIHQNIVRIYVPVLSKIHDGGSIEETKDVLTSKMQKNDTQN